MLAPPSSAVVELSFVSNVGSLQALELQTFINGNCSAVIAALCGLNATRVGVVEFSPRPPKGTAPVAVVYTARLRIELKAIESTGEKTAAKALQTLRETVNSVEVSIPGLGYLEKFGINVLQSPVPPKVVPAPPPPPDEPLLGPLGWVAVTASALVSLGFTVGAVWLTRRWWKLSKQIVIKEDKKEEGEEQIIPMLGDKQAQTTPRNTVAVAPPVYQQKPLSGW